MNARAALAGAFAGLLLMTWPSLTSAAPCPGASECPYASVTQISAPPAADELRGASQVAVGPGGVLWVADEAANRVMRFSAGGAFQGSIGAGTLSGIAGLAVSQATGDVYVTEGYQGRVLRFAATGQLLGTVGPGSGVGQVRNPAGIAVHPITHRVYVTDSPSGDGSRLQSFDPALTSPAVESTSAAYTAGASIAFDATGANLWALPGSNTLRKFAIANLSTPLVEKCPPGSAVGECQLEGTAGGLAVDPAGNVWIADRSNDRIQRFDANGLNPVVYGAPGAGDLGFTRTLGLAVDGATILVTDVSGRVRRYDRTTLALQSTFGGPTPAGLRNPRVAIGPNGSVYEQDLGAALVVRVSPGGAVLSVFGQAGLGGGQLYRPSAIGVDGGGDVLQLDQDGRRLQKFTGAGAFVWARGPLGAGDPDLLANANGITTGPEREIYVTDSGRRRVAVYSTAGNLIRAFGANGSADGQFLGPRALTFDDGSVFVLDDQRKDIQRLSSSGAFQGKFGTPGGGPGQFLNPSGIAADGRGSIYVLDAGNSRVQVFGRDGSPRQSFGERGTGPGQLDRPFTIAADGGAVVVSDASGRVQRFALPQPPGAGPAPGPAGPKAFAATTAFRLPSTRRCINRTAGLKLGWRRPRGVIVDKVEVLIGRKRVLRRTGRKARASITLRARSLPKRRFTLTLRVTPRGGRTVSAKQTYRVCKARKKAKRR